MSDDNSFVYGSTSRKYSFIDGLDVNKEASGRLTYILDKIVSGNDTVLTAPYCNRKSPDDILKEWSNLFNEKRTFMNDQLIKIEESQISKFGPRSIAKPYSERKESIMDGFKHDDCPELEIVNQTARNTLRPLSICSALKFLKNSTNSGLPYLLRKGLVKERVVDNFSELLARKDPCLMFTRTQENQKTRTVWGYPIADTLNEMMFYRPVLEFQKKLKWRSALLGPDDVAKRISEMYIMKDVSSSFISIDFSAYDQSISPTLQKFAFDYIRIMYDSQQHDSIDYIRDRFKSIPLVTPQGVLTGDHGVPSGSTFTNEVDSIVQYLILKQHFSNEMLSFQVQGDDGAYLIKNKSVERLYSTFEKYGLKVNTDKSLVSEDTVTYLQCLYHKDYLSEGKLVGVYPTYRALGKIIFPERWASIEDFGLTGSDYFSIRTISILENCKYHPLFETLVNFIYSLDKYKLNYTQAGLDKFVEMFSQTEGTEGVIVNNPGSNLKGLNRFETVKILRSLRNQV